VLVIDHGTLLFDGGHPVWLVVSPVAAVAAVAASSLGWRRVLRRYTGASA
jgi:ABC-type uncharacterized transport system permease subunit